MSPIPLEDAVLRMLLAGKHPTLAQLRRQFDAATVTSREQTGAGFFTHFSVPASLRVQRDELCLEDVRGAIVGLENGAGFILFITNGVIDVLEGYSYGEDWPSEVASFTLSYSDPARVSTIAALDS